MQGLYYWPIGSCLSWVGVGGVFVVDNLEQSGNVGLLLGICGTVLIKSDIFAMRNDFDKTQCLLQRLYKQTFVEKTEWAFRCHTIMSFVHLPVLYIRVSTAADY